MKRLIKNPEAFYKALAIIALLVLLGVFCRSVGFSLILPLILFIFGVHLYFYKKADLKLYLNLGLLLTLIVFSAYALTNFGRLTPYDIPIAGLAILTMLLFNDLELAFIMAVLASIASCVAIKADLGFMLVYLIGSMAGVYVVKGARTRSELIKAGLFTGLVQGFCMFLIMPSKEMFTHGNFFATPIWHLILNGMVAAGLVMVTLKVFEYLFGVVTNFSLLELSDFNQPLLKRMVLECPGTYHHSLIVSNISEAAADAIGANALLARVGAYYHDIGKLNKPEYFTENQSLDSNKHDQLEPSMSRLVILNHVKEGVDLGRRHKLSQQILDFIPQHHGTSLIYYFYQRALEDAAEDEKIDEENFRYPGPKPQTREAAIVMLADSVEGAVRALPEPTISKIEEVVRKIINNKFIDGQLDECDLTLKDIHRIGATCTRTLGAIYHSRIQYPEKKNGTASPNRKLSEKIPPKSRSNQRDNKNDAHK